MMMNQEMEEHSRLMQELMRKNHEIQQAYQHLHRLEHLVDQQATMINVLIDALKED